MAKILKDKEMLDIIQKAVNDPDEIIYQDSYLHFLEDLATVITEHFGGEHGIADYMDDTLRYTVAFNVNENVPGDGGVYKNYDTDVVWKDGEEIQP